MSSNLSRGLQRTIDNTAIEDGKLRFAIDTGRLFLDVQNERVEFTDMVVGLTYSEITALTEPLPKLYLSSDTHQLLYYDPQMEKWYAYTKGESSVDISTFRFDENGNTILVFQDGTTKTITNPKIAEYESRIKTLEDTLAEYTATIDIIKASIS